MPYYFLAESFNEMNYFSELVDQLERGILPFAARDSAPFLEMELSRIKTRVSRDMLVFGASVDIFVRSQLMQTYGLIGRILALKSQLPAKTFMDENQLYYLYLCTELRCKLGDLSEFLEELRRG